ncbi:hypothetical protein L7F22_037340 [Adiantum nelumboides]|nr:hypothetical protein [Adiantum nelumboides]
MDRFILQNQKGFIKKIFILDAIITLWEGMEHAQEQNQEYYFFKVDFEKAYDKVEWDFILQSLQDMGLGKKFIKYVHVLLGNALAKIATNVSDALGLLIKNHMQTGKLKGIKVEGASDDLCLQMFVDDTNALLNADDASAASFLDCLSIFCTDSGSVINHSKTGFKSSNGTIPAAVNTTGCHTLSLMGLDVIGAVEELHNLSAKEMNKLLRDSQHLFTLRLRTGRGSFLRVNLERLVSRLPLHLLACLASRGTEPRLRYLLRGVRLLHSFSDLALRHPKLEQSFLQEVKIREQILDLIIYMLITLAGPEQEGRHGSSFTILHAALVACSLHLLPAFVAGEWSDLVPVLLVHPKVDIFMDAAFDAVRRDIGLLQTKLRALNAKLMSNRVSSNVAESMAEVIAQQCEASVQVLQSLCQPQAFRDKVLNHKCAIANHQSRWGFTSVR